MLIKHHPFISLCDCLNKNMRFALASALLLAAKLAPSAAEDVISLLARNYYAYGYEGDVNDGVPNG